MLFDVRPKEDKRDLYDREEELSEIRESIDRRVWLSVYGFRRVGKTSVVRTVLNEFNYPYLYFDLSPYMGLRSVSYQALTPNDMRFSDM